MNTCSQILSPVYLTQTPGCITSVALLPENSSSSLPCPFSILFQNSLTLDLSNTFSHFPLGYFIQLEKNHNSCSLDWTECGIAILLCGLDPLFLCIALEDFISYLFHLTFLTITHYSYLEQISLPMSSVQLLSLVWFFATPWARLPCPSPTPRAYSNSCRLHWWCHLTISSSVGPFSSFFQSFA